MVAVADAEGEEACTLRGDAEASSMSSSSSLEGFSPDLTTTVAEAAEADVVAGAVA